MQAAELGRAAAVVGILWVVALATFVSSTRAAARGKTHRLAVAARGEAGSQRPHRRAPESAERDSVAGTAHGGGPDESDRRRGETQLVSGAALVIATLVLFGFAAAWYASNDPTSQRTAQEQLLVALRQDGHSEELITNLLLDLLREHQSPARTDLRNVAFRPFRWIRPSQAASGVRQDWQGRLTWEERALPSGDWVVRSCVLTAVRDGDGAWRLQGTRQCEQVLQQ